MANSHEPYGNYVDLLSAKPIPAEWIIENLLIKGLTILGAPPKAGKSIWTAIFASLIADWHCKVLPRFLSKVRKPGPTVIYSAEATAEELRQMVEEGLRIKGTKPDGHVMVCDDETDFQLDDEHGMKNLLHDLKVLEPQLAIIDPFRDFHSLEEKDSGGMVKLLKPLRKWAKENDAACVVVHHTTKPPPQNRQDHRYGVSDLRGSGAIFGKADGVLMLTPVSEGNPAHIHASAIFKRAKSWTTEIKLAVWDSDLKEGTEVLKNADTSVLKAIKKGLSLSAIQAQLHMTSKGLKDVLEKLRRNGFLKEKK